MKSSIQERFERYYIPEPNSGCWLWTGFVTPEGYGYFHAGRDFTKYAHRISWQMHRGSIPEKMYVLHKCDMPCCVNPDHLYVGTQFDNMRDMKSRGRMSKGHHSKGSDNGQAKLNEYQVISIRSSSLKSSEIAHQFSVSRQLINDIRARRSWRHL